MTLTRNSILVLLCLTLAACANDPLMQAGRATSTDSARAIDRTMAEAEQQGVVEQPAGRSTSLPADVTAALLPPLTEEPEGDERFDLNARDVDARAFFEALVEGTPYNVVVHPEVEVTISFRLNDVTVPEVMDIAREVYDLSIQRRGRLYQIDTDRVQTRLFPINYLHFKRSGGSETRVSSGQVSNSRNNNSDSQSNIDNGDDGSSGNVIGTRIATDTESDFWRDLQQALSMIVGGGEDHQVITNPGAGLVMVKANGETLRLVQDYLERTELIMQRQVVLKAKVLEVALNEGYQQGINWADVQSEGGTNYLTTQSLGGQTIRPSDIGGLFSATVRAGDFSGLIQLLGEQGNVQTLSSPRIATVNNQKAVIKVGTDEFFVTDIDFDDNNTATRSLRGRNVLSPRFRQTGSLSGRKECSRYRIGSIIAFDPAS